MAADSTFVRSGTGCLRAALGDSFASGKSTRGTTLAAAEVIRESEWQGPAVHDGLRTKVSGTLASGTHGPRISREPEKESMMRMKRIVTAMMAGCAAVVISAVPALAAQTPQEHQHAATAKAKPPSDMAAKCQAMMAEREQMKTEMKAADQRLEDLVAKMNAASGKEKTDATAAVVNEMVAQRRAMRDGMMKMQHEMMSHMMEHMQAGKDSMAMCPMMKPMGNMKPMGDMKH